MSKTQWPASLIEVDHCRSGSVNRAVERCRKATIRRCSRVWLVQAFARHLSAGFLSCKVPNPFMTLALTDADNAARAGC